MFPTEFFTDGKAELVAFVPVAAAPPLPGRVERLELAPGRYAVATYDGPMVDLDSAYGALGWSVTEQAIAADGPVIERYLPLGDEDDLIAHRTEVCWPVHSVPLVSIASGPVIQICWVTDDIEATERLLGEQFGVAAWTRIPDVRFEPRDDDAAR